jgi:Ca2+-transporting ATPase
MTVTMDRTVTDVDRDPTPPFAREASDVVGAMGSDPSSGLTRAEASARLSSHGPNAIVGEAPPSGWTIAAQQLRVPMNLMLVAVTIVSFLIGETSTGLIVGLLIVFNIALGTRQELKARASVDALSKMQVPQAKVLRDGELILVPAVDLVPGDIIQLEAGDIVPADGRILRSATLETQEADSPVRARPWRRTRAF